MVKAATDNLRRVIAWLACALACAAFAHANAQAPIQPLKPLEIKPVRVATTAERGTKDWIQAAAFVDRVFKRAGLVHTLEFVPGNRSLMYIRSGVIDVEFARFRDFDKVFAEGLRVDPAAYSEKFFAISLSPSIAPKSWEEAMRYSIAFKAGYKAIEYYTTGAQRREAVTNDDACLGMVKLRRVQVCIGTESQFLDNATFLNDKDLVITHMLDIPLHFWVGPHRPELQARLSKALLEMQKSGELAKFYPLSK